MSRAQSSILEDALVALKKVTLPSDEILFEGVYVGIVTKCKTDTARSNAVRVKILGLTDELPSGVQPWAQGSNNDPIPAPGTYVDITFADGDIHSPRWSNPAKARNGKIATKGQKQSKQMNQEIYNAQDGTVISYNKATGVWTLQHHSGAKLKIDKKGTLIHEAGPGGISLPTFPVITQASMCPYTGMPHSNGSKYMRVADNPLD